MGRGRRRPRRAAPGRDRNRGRSAGVPTGAPGAVQGAEDLELREGRCRRRPRESFSAATSPRTPCPLPAASLLTTALLALGAPASAGAATVRPGQSIQAAIDAAATGETIEIASGTYSEQVSTGKTVVLKAAPGAVLVNPAGATGPTLAFTGSGGETVTGLVVVSTVGNAVEVGGGHHADPALAAHHDRQGARRQRAHRGLRQRRSGQDGDDRLERARRPPGDRGALRQPDGRGRGDHRRRAARDRAGRDRGPDARRAEPRGRPDRGHLRGLDRPRRPRRGDRHRDRRPRRSPPTRPATPSPTPTPTAAACSSPRAAFNYHLRADAPVIDKGADHERRVRHGPRRRPAHGRQRERLRRRRVRQPRPDGRARRARGTGPPERPHRLRRLGLLRPRGRQRRRHRQLPLGLRRRRDRRHHHAEDDARLRGPRDPRGDRDRHRPPGPERGVAVRCRCSVIDGIAPTLSVGAPRAKQRIRAYKTKRLRSGRIVRTKRRLRVTFFGSAQDDTAMGKVVMALRPVAVRKGPVPLVRRQAQARGRRLRGADPDRAEARRTAAGATGCRGAPGCAPARTC